MTKETYMAPEDKKVLVTYQDGTTRETTVKELRSLFKDESTDWFEHFFNQLKVNLTAFGKFAKYEIILD